MTEFRPGGHWRVTIVAEGTEPPDASGHRPDARLRAVVMDGKVLTTDARLAERICALLGGAGECDCGHDGLDAMFHMRPCPIAELRVVARDLGYYLVPIQWEQQ
jgi:hypothetical protein